MHRANADVAERRPEPVPTHLRDTSYPGAKRLGHGAGYQYPHDYPGHHVTQLYLPEAPSRSPTTSPPTRATSRRSRGECWEAGAERKWTDLTRSRGSRDEERSSSE